MKAEVEAVLAAAICQRDEVPTEAVKKQMRERGIEARQADTVTTGAPWKGPSR